jgi:hypothetical protein
MGALSEVLRIGQGATPMLVSARRAQVRERANSFRRFETARSTKVSSSGNKGSGIADPVSSQTDTDSGTSFIIPAIVNILFLPYPEVNPAPTFCF